MTTAGLHVGFDGVFAPTSTITRSADIAFANLEGVLAHPDPQATYDKLAFRGDPRMAKALAQAGFKVVSIANNHIMQHGRAAYEETLATLRANGVQPCGERAERPTSCRPVVIHVAGCRIGFLGYSAVADQYCRSEDLPYAKFEVQQTIRDVHALRPEVDHVVVSVHIGIEARFRLPEEDLAALRSVSRAGAIAVLGHHTHVLQATEYYGDGVICHNLGNFIFDLNWHRAFRRTALVEIVLRTDQVRPAVTFHPCFIDRGFIPRPARSSHERPTFSERVYESDEKLDCAEEDPRLLQARKILFFLANFTRGTSRLKWQFIADKVRGRIFGQCERLGRDT